MELLNYFLNSNIVLVWKEGLGLECLKEVDTSCVYLIFNLNLYIAYSKK